MSDFLFRMVARAAGLPSGNSPRPRPEVHWLPPLDPAVVAPPHQTVLPSLGAAGSGSKTRTAAPFAATDISPGQRRRPDRPTPLVNGGLAGAIAPNPQPERKSDQPLQPLPERELESPVLPEMTAEKKSQLPFTEEGEIRNDIREIQTFLPIRVVPKVVRAAEVKDVPRPVGTRLERHEVPVARDKEDSTWQPPPEVVPLSRRNAAKPAQEHPSVHQQEPPVEVKIDRVEVHMEAAPVAPLPAPSRPQGFAEYAALRRYAARPWDFRNR